MIFVTRYSFITAILLSNLFFLLFVCLSGSDRILRRIPLRVFAVLGAALLVKILFPIEVESTIEISSFQIYPAIIAFLGKKLFTIGGFVVQVRGRSALRGAGFIFTDSWFVGSGICRASATRDFWRFWKRSSRRTGIGLKQR